MRSTHTGPAGPGESDAHRPVAGALAGGEVGAGPGDAAGGRTAAGPPPAGRRVRIAARVIAALPRRRGDRDRPGPPYLPTGGSTALSGLADYNHLYASYGSLGGYPGYPGYAEPPPATDLADRPAGWRPARAAGPGEPGSAADGPTPASGVNAARG